MNLSTLTVPGNEQDLRFRDILFVNRFDSNSPDRWFPTRNIDYKINIFGNGFHNVLGEGYEPDTSRGYSLALNTSTWAGLSRGPIWWARLEAADNGFG